MRSIIIIIFLVFVPFVGALSVDFVVSDHLGSPTAVICSQSSGGCEQDSERWRADYEPFGANFNEQGENRHNYNAKEEDKNTGLHYYGARYYTNTLGRFSTTDILTGEPANPQSLNRYTYVKNNPIGFIDPTGKLEVRKDLALKMGVTGKAPFQGEIITSVWNYEDPIRNSFNFFSTVPRNIKTLQDSGRDPTTYYPQNLVTMVNNIESAIKKGFDSELEKASFIYQEFQKTGAGTTTYDLTRSGKSVADLYLKNPSDAGTILSLDLFRQVNGAEKFSRIEQLTTGGVCRDKVSALNEVFNYYGLEATSMGYRAEGQKRGHAISVINFKEEGFVGFDPTNSPTPLPLEVPSDYAHQFPITPPANKLQPMTTSPTR